MAGCRWVIWVWWVCYHIITWLAFTKDSVVRNYIVVKNTTDRLLHSEIPNWFRQARVDASGPRDVFIRITLRWSECWPAVWLIIAGAGNESLHMLGVLSCQCACVRVPGAVTSASRRPVGGYARNAIGSAVPMDPLLSLNHSLCAIDSQ